MEEQERETVQACINKKKHSQAQLYQQYAPLLFGVALRYTKSEEDAQDILQEAFIRIFSNIEQYKGNGKLSAWMTRIVINQALKMYQSTWKKYVTETYQEQEQDFVDERIVDADSLTHEILLQFIQELPTGYKMMFNLCEIEEYSYDQVAKMLHCTPSNCRSQLFKAKNILRKKVSEFLKKEGL